MGTIKCGFWMCRFLVTDKEFVEFVNFCAGKEFRFHASMLNYPLASPQEVIENYSLAYSRIISKTSYANHGYDCYSLKADWFKGGLGTTSRHYGNYPFFQIDSPKAYSVSDGDGYFHYEDIHQQEPRAKEVFSEVSSIIKKISKPIFENGRPVYSIRISEDAWNDLKESYWYETFGKDNNVTTKWK